MAIFVALAFISTVALADECLDDVNEQTSFLQTEMRMSLPDTRLRATNAPDEAGPDMESLVLAPYYKDDGLHHHCTPADLEKHGEKRIADSVSYVSIGRTGSLSVGGALDGGAGDGMVSGQNHNCTLADHEKAGEKRIIVTVRHPVARVISSISRKHEKGEGVEFETADDMVSAFRNDTHPQHEYAASLWNGHLLPIVEYYLQSYPLTGYEPNADLEVFFLCTGNLTEEYNELAAEQDIPLMEKHLHHSSKTSSGQERYLSEDNRAWLSELYRADVELCMEKCPRSCLEAAS